MSVSAVNTKSEVVPNGLTAVGQFDIERLPKRTADVGARFTKIDFKPSAHVEERRPLVQLFDAPEQAANDHARAAIAKLVGMPFSGDLDVRQVAGGQNLAAGTAIVSLTSLTAVRELHGLKKDPDNLRTGPVVRLKVDACQGWDPQRSRAGDIRAPGVFMALTVALAGNQVEGAAEGAGAGPQAHRRRPVQTAFGACDFIGSGARHFSPVAALRINAFA